MGGQDDARAAVHPGQLLHGDGVAQGIQPGAAVLRGEGDAHEAHLAQLPDGLVRELVLLVQHERDGFDLLLRKRTDFGAEFLVCLCGLKRHSRTSSLILIKFINFQAKEKLSNQGSVKISCRLWARSSSSSLF